MPGGPAHKVTASRFLFNVINDTLKLKQTKNTINEHQLGSMWNMKFTGEDGKERNPVTTHRIFQLRKVVEGMKEGGWSYKSTTGREI